MQKARTALYVTLALGLAACGTQVSTGSPQSTASPLAVTTATTDAFDDAAVPQLPAFTTDYAIITFRSPPAAQYEGGIRGLAPTKPERGQKLDPDSPAVRAYQKFLENEQASYRAYLARVAPQAAVVRDYTLTLNGIAVKTNGASLDALRKGPNVKDAAYSTLYRPTMNRSLSQIGVTDTWRTMSGLTGAGIKVGVIDSGIDRTHPFFACKTNILSRVYASGVAGFGPEIVDSHGTHVAGTVAGCVTVLGEDNPLAGQTVSGVAPAAELYDYNVFPGFGGGFVAFGGSAFSHDIAEAIEDAVRDGMDVVNMSLGGSVQGPKDFLQEAVNAAVEAGLVFAVSAGNSGPGNYTIGSPGSAQNAITVGAVTNSHYIGVKVHLSNGTSIGGAAGEFDPFAGEKAVSGAGMALASPSPACEAIDTNVAGKIAIIDRGACTFTTKVSNAQAAGAIGVLVVNNQPGDPIAMATSPVADPPIIPALMVAQSDRDLLVQAIDDGVTTTIDGSSRTEIVTNNDGMLARFSSRGPTPYTGIIKPDVVAPGVNIYSSVLKDGYAMYSGTSMAAPHVAGAAALLLQANGDWSPFDVKAALATTARRTHKLENSIADVELKVAARGSGLIDVPAALAVPALVTPSNVSFGYHNPGGKSKAVSVLLTVRSTGNSPVTCSATAEGSVHLSANSVTADPTGTLTVTLENPSSRSGNEEGSITLTCNGTELFVPWASYLNPPGPR